MRVTYASPETSAPVTTDVAVPEFAIVGEVPQGAEGLAPYVAGRTFDLTLETSALPETLEVGDAIDVTYTAELAGMPAIFIPPLIATTEIAGAKAYVDEATVEDRPHGSAVRREHATLVVTDPGTLRVPARSISWWNVATEQVEVARTDGFEISVAGVVAAADDAAPRELGRELRRRANIGLVVSFVVFLILIRSKRFRARMSERRRAWRRSEAWAFEAVRRSVRRPIGDLYAALLVWVGRTDAGDLRRFAEQWGDAALVASVASLSRSMHDPSAGDSPSPRRLVKDLAAARARYLARATAAEAALPPLNP